MPSFIKILLKNCEFPTDVEIGCFVNIMVRYFMNKMEEN